MPARQSFLGEVIGTAMRKTVKVRVERLKLHPIVLKPVRRHTNFLVHDPEQKCVVGDYVRIDSCDKISKLKHFTLGDVVIPAHRYTDANGQLHTQRAYPENKDFQRKQQSLLEQVQKQQSILARKL
ncbi:hypothetical protein BC831DRAFT_459778 [Entophlyctis helioformis]|nr:hypothetical protein BC831DRAFT_459778 [Entophlyctis helioformis]